MLQVDGNCSVLCIKYFMTSKLTQATGVIGVAIHTVANKNYQICQWTVVIVRNICCCSGLG